MSSPRRVILVVGYSVFSHYQLNPSEEIVRELDGSYINGYHVQGIALPVSYRYVRERLPALLEEVMPSIALGIGLAPRIREPVLELVASNVASSVLPDESGEAPGYEYLDGDMLRCVHTTLPVREILEKCTRQGLSLRASVGIGTYLCGVAGYYIMNHCSRNHCKGGFIHIPPSTELAMRHGLQGYKPLKELLETVRCILEAASSQAS